MENGRTKPVWNISYMLFLLLTSAAVFTACWEDLDEWYAAKEPLYCTVTYHGNGNTSGSVPVASIDYRRSDTITVAGNTGPLARTYFVFTGWNTAPDGGGTAYAPGATFTARAGRVDLYAQWDDVYAVGDTGPAGGLIFYDNSNYATDGWRYLEAAPVDQFDDKPENLAMSWDKAVSVCGSYSVNYSGNDYGDWYLPSKNELNSMYVNLASNNVGGFQRVYSQGSYYWSATEETTGYKWMQEFTSGGQNSEPTGTGARVRAARKF